MVFDTIEAFKKQFTRVEGGYLFYPSRKTGGKFVSDEEYAQLVRGWERVFGRSGVWKVSGVTVGVVVFWTLLSDVFSFPEWAASLLILTVVVAISAWTLWASTTPHRLVKDRLPVTLPKTAAAAKRDARAALSWPFVFFALTFSGLAFFGSVNATERSPGGWAWLIGSGVMLGLYIWIAFSKLTDRSS